MALKALMLRKRITDKQKALDVLNGKDEEFRTKEAELEKSIDEVTNEEERDAVNAEIEAFETEKATNETEKTKLREEIDALEAELAEVEQAQNTEPEQRKDEKEMNTTEMNIEAQERQAFADYVRTSAGAISQHRDNDYNMIQGNNGAVVPKTIAQEIITKVREICPIFEKATKYNIKGTLEVPYYPASSSHVVAAAYANEMDELTASSGDFNTVEMTGFLAGALSKISKKLINNTDIDVVPFIVNQMAEAFKNFYENELINGTANKATGMLAGITQLVTAGALNYITADELISVQMSIPTAYQANACWLMAPATLQLIRKLKDGENRYLLNPDFRNEFGWTLLGKPVYISDNMPGLGTANNKAIVYGDLSGLGCKVVENLEIQVLLERFATQHAVGIVGWTEFDAKVVNAQKIAAIKCGAADPQ